MRIACLQFAPQVGDVDNNLNRADAVLSRANPDDLDLLVLPELAFSGYNFKSLSDISPFLEPTGAGITSLWARTTALKYNCIVAAGYPEKVDVSRNWPTSPEYYNSAIVVNQEGETIANYRKNHLYYTDETWALEGGDGFYNGYMPGIGRVAMGICMDLNPYRFEAPWSAYEFAFHTLDINANVVLMSMAWLTREDPRHFSRTPKEPDMETLTYWIRRLEPLIRAENEDEIIVIFANRTGTEEEAVYAGTSAVVGIQYGEVNVYGLLGRGEKELLVVDTSLPPFAKLVYRPDEEENPIDGSSSIATVEPSTVEHPKEAESPARSAGSSTSNKSEPVPRSQASSVVDSAQDPARRIFGGHVLITQDFPTPVTGTFPTTPFEESPASPRYFWIPAEHLKTPDPLTTRSSTSHSLVKRADSATLPVRSNVTRAVKEASEEVTSRSENNSSDLKELLDTLRKVNPDPQPDAAGPARPSSPKSRHASRTGRGERSNSVLARRPPSAFGSRTQVSVNEQDSVPFRPESPKSRNASRTRSRNRHVDTPIQLTEPFHTRGPSRVQNRLPTPLEVDAVNTNNHQNHHAAHNPVPVSPEQRRSTSPDMEKIGADLLVFEEGARRPRRDSLECHADEDDFIVFHASMRRDRHGGNNSKGEKDAERPSSQKEHTPRSTGSPGFSFAKSPKENRTTSKPQPSPDFPDSRAISRGRQRTTQRTEGKASPKSSNLKSPPLSSSADSRSTPQSSKPPNSFSRYKSPESKQNVANGSKGSSSRDRHDSTKKLKVTTNDISLLVGSTKKQTRTTSEDIRDHSPMIYASSIRTIETTSAPVTPESAPPTPKAMVLEPDWDQIIPIQTSEAESVPVKAMDADLDRPKSVVW